MFINGLFDKQFWKSDVDPLVQPCFKWYLDLIEKEVHSFYLDFKNENSPNDKNLKTSYDSKKERRQQQLKIILLGHSAGGKSTYEIICTTRT